MQIRSGTYRVPSEPRSIPAERDAGRNRAILSIGDSLAWLEPIKFSRRHYDRRRVIAREAFSIGYLLSRRIRHRCRLRARSRPCLIDAFDPVVARGRDYRVRDPCTSQRVSFFCFSLASSLSSKDYLNLSRVKIFAFPLAKLSARETSALFR